MATIEKNSYSMLGFKKLLVATDCSQYTLEAINEALILATICVK